MLWAPFTKIHKNIFQKEVTSQLLPENQVSLQDIIIENFPNVHEVGLDSAHEAEPTV